MSYAINKLPTRTLVDPVVKINERREYGVLKGGSEVSWKPILSTSYSASSFQFSAPPPSPGIIVDRKVYLQVPVTINFTGTTGGNFLLQSGYDAFRAFPLSSIMNTLNVTVNNTASSINMSDVIQGLLRYNTDVYQKEHEYSFTPSCLDQAQRYEDLVNSVRNPLGAYIDSNDGSNMGRGGFPYATLANTTTTAQVVAVLTEPLFLSPFLFGQGDHSGFIGVQNMDFTFNWNSDLTRIWSHATGSGSTISSITVSFGQPALIFKYITPQLEMPIPMHVEYPYYVVDRYPTDYGSSVAPLATAQISSSNIQLQSIPKRMYIFVRRSNSDQDYTTTDSFFAINSITINWNNRSGLMSSATQQDLYNISKKNGCNLSWAQWGGGITNGQVPQSYLLSGTSNTGIGLVGSVLAIDFASDIGLADDLSAGVNGTFQLQLTLSTTNLNPVESIPPTLYICTVSEGTFTIENNRSIAQIGVLSRKDVLNSSFIHNWQSAPQYQGNFLGGNFFGDVKDFFTKTIPDVVRKAAPYAKDAFNIAKQVAPYALPLLGLGEGEGAMVGGARRRARRGGSLIGGCEMCMGEGCMDCMGEGAYTGGKMMSRAQLKRRM